MASAPSLHNAFNTGAGRLICRRLGPTRECRGIRPARRSARRGQRGSPKRASKCRCLSASSSDHWCRSQVDVTARDYPLAVPGALLRIPIPTSLNNNNLIEPRSGAVCLSTSLRNGAARTVATTSSAKQCLICDPAPCRRQSVQSNCQEDPARLPWAPAHATVMLCRFASPRVHQGLPIFTRLGACPDVTVSHSNQTGRLEGHEPAR